MEHAISRPVPEAAVSWYHDNLAWPVRWEQESVVLPLGHGIVAFDVPAGRARVALEQLAYTNCSTPVLYLVGPECRVIILAESDETVFGQFQMPERARYLAAPRCLRLPVMPSPGTGALRWLREPDPKRRWLPRAGAVLSAVTTALGIVSSAAEHQGPSS